MHVLAKTANYVEKNYFNIILIYTQKNLETKYEILDFFKYITYSR